MSLLKITVEKLPPLQRLSLEIKYARMFSCTTFSHIAVYLQCLSLLHACLPITDCKTSLLVFCRYREDLEIEAGDHHKISEEEATFTLTIRDTTVDDDAEYTCTATNTAGSVSTSAELFVNPAGEAMELLAHGNTSYLLSCC